MEISGFLFFSAFSGSNISPYCCSSFNMHIPRRIYCSSEREREREKGGTMGYLLNYSPKFYYNVILFVGLTSLGTWVKFDWFIINLNVQTFQPLILI